MSGLSRRSKESLFSVLPAGIVMPFAGSTAPEGWGFCDGATLSRTDYPELFLALGVAHGEGDGSTTFHLPDYRGRFMRGVNAGAGRDNESGSRTAANLGGNTGDNVGAVQDDKTRRPRSTSFTSNNTGAHTHPGPHNVTGNPDGATDNTGSSTYNRSYWRGGYLNSHGIPSRGNHSHSVTGGGDVESRPINAGVHYIIKL